MEACWEKKRKEEKLSLVNSTTRWLLLVETDAPACMAAWDSGFRVNTGGGR